MRNNRRESVAWKVLCPKNGRYFHADSHPAFTLQLLLALECFASLITGVDRSLFVISQLRQGAFDDRAPALTKFFGHMCGSINNYLCVAYTSERILATVYVRTYEKHRPYYGSLCVLVMVSVDVDGWLMLHRDPLVK